MSHVNDEIAGQIASILGYSCETQAPNSAPTTEYITDRWMKPRRDALEQMVRERMAQAWFDGYEKGNLDGYFGTSDERARSPFIDLDPYRESDRG